MFSQAPISSAAISELYFAVHGVAAKGEGLGVDASSPVVDYVLANTNVAVGADSQAATYITDVTTSEAGLVGASQLGPVSWDGRNTNASAADALQTEITTFTVQTASPLGAVASQITAASMVGTDVAQSTAVATAIASFLSPQSHASAGAADNSAITITSWGTMHAAAMDGKSAQGVLTQFSVANKASADGQNTQSTTAAIVVKNTSVGVGADLQVTVVGFASKIQEHATTVTSIATADTTVLRTFIASITGSNKQSVTMLAPTAVLETMDAQHASSAGSTITRTSANLADAVEASVASNTIERAVAENAAATHSSGATKTTFPQAVAAAVARVIAKYRKRTYLS